MGDEMQVLYREEEPWMKDGSMSFGKKSKGS